MCWTEEEIQLLKDNYLKYTDIELSEIVFKGSRSKRAIEKQRLLLGLKRNSSKTPKRWTEEEKMMLKDIYEDYTNNEISEIFFKGTRSRKSINEMGWKMGLVKSEETQKRINAEKTREIKSYNLGRNMKEESKQKLSATMKKQYKEGRISPWKNRTVSEEERERSRQRNKERGLWTGENNPRHKNPLFGEKNGRWLGGITSLSQALRENITLWKKESMCLCEYRCALTGMEFTDIHHFYPFNKMIKEVLLGLDLEIMPNLASYPNSDILINAIQLKHEQLGICLSSEIHKLFHDKYSYIDFNLDNFTEFINDYFNGVYDEKLPVSHRSYNSKYSIDDVIDKINKINVNVYKNNTHTR